MLKLLLRVTKVSWLETSSKNHTDEIMRKFGVVKLPSIPGIAGVAWKCLVCFIFVNSRRSTGNKIPIVEDVGDDDWNVVLTYLDYAEPTFDILEGFTTDDFTDPYEGYQTEPSHAKSFGWDFTGHGEVPFAAMLVSGHNTNLACMGVLVTMTNVVTPCSCVRTKIFAESGKQDYDPNRGRYYEFDLGKDIYVVVDEIEYESKRIEAAKSLSAHGYPHISSVTSSKKCFQIYEEGKYEDDIDIYRQRWTPAILNISKPIEFDAVLRWPPEAIGYSSGPFKAGSGQEWLYYDRARDSEDYVAEILSYRFIPTDQKQDKSRDNFKRRYFRVPNRLVELSVRLGVQSYCYFNEGFTTTNQYLVTFDLLVDMLCWYDIIDVGTEDIYPEWRDSGIPHYTRTVYGGLLGAPIIHKGSWVGWIIQLVDENSTDVRQTPNPDYDWPIRTTWTRKVDDEIVDYINEVLPELKGGNRKYISDGARGSAIRDNKVFIPDSDLQKHDVDLEYYNKIGFRRHYKVRRGPRSGSSAIIQGQATLNSTILLFIIRSINLR